MKLTWNASPNTETGVVIEKRAMGSNWSTVATLPTGATSYIDSVLEYNTLYEYRAYETVGTLTTATSNVAQWNTNMWVMQDTDIANIYGFMDVADFTSDGRMDMLLNGAMIYNGTAEDITKATFENTVANGWVKRDITPSVLTPGSAISFADFNDDFLPDIYQQGYVWASGYQSEVFLNNGDKSFSPTSNAFTGGANYIQSFFDFDMDNDLDVLTTQPDTYPTVRDAYRNSGGGNFVLAEATACNSCGEIVAVADFDRDGDEDVIRQINSSFQLFLNTPQGLIGTDVDFPFYGTKVTVTDYNSDGLPDIALLTSSSYHGGVILKNLGPQDGSTPRFVSLSVDLSSGDQTSLSADFDHDGRTDLAVLSPSVNILLNKGSDKFDNYIAPHLRVSLHVTNIVDYDNDGDLDIILGGYLLKDYSNYLRKTQVLLNQTIVSGKGVDNKSPETPGALSSSQDELGLHLSWSSPVDDHTSPEGLTYDVVLYRNGKIITKGSLNPSTGQRLRLRPGTFTGPSTFNNLEVGSYSWRVQAVDGSFAGSVLSAEGTFVFLPPPPSIRDTMIYQCGRSIALGTQGSGLKWYRDKELTQLIASGSFHPEQTQTVYVTQTVNGYQGISKTVNITIIDKPSMPVSTNLVEVCETSFSQTIWANGVNLRWYSDEGMSEFLSSQQELQIPAANATYYVTQTIEGCESDALAIQVTVKTIESEIYSNGQDIMTREENANFYIWYRNGDYYQGTTINSIPFDGEVATYEVYIVKGACYEYSAPFVSSPDNITSVEGVPESVLSIYPNPTSSVVTLKTQKTIASLTIVDAMGKWIYSAPQNNAMVETVDVSQWTNGVYTIIIDDGKVVYTKRLVIL